MFTQILSATLFASSVLAAAAAPSPTASGTASNCNNYYQVSSGDTCAAIVDKYSGLTLSEFFSYNTAVNNPSCNNLQIGYYVCVGVGAAAPTTTASAAVPSPTASGIVSNCDEYYQVKSGDTCQAIVGSSSGLTLSQFFSYNPAVNNPACNNLQIGTYYCTGISSAATTTPKTTTPATTATTTTSKPTTPATTATTTTSKPTTPATTAPATTAKTTTTAVSTPSPAAPSIVNNCNAFYQVLSGDTCTSIATKFGSFTVSQFQTWNKAVNTACTNLIIGDYYCVGIGAPASTTLKTTTTKTAAPPSPTQSGIASNCKTYYKVVSGDECNSVEAKFGISDANFRAWNSYLNAACSNLWTAYYCCIGV